MAEHPGGFQKAKEPWD